MPDTVAEAAAAFERKALSPVELAQALFERIEALNPSLRAFLRLDEERALRRARWSQARMMAGERLGPLDGVPIAHKDNLDTAGLETTGNSRRFLGRVPAQNAAVVERLARQGAVSLGKLACYESAFAGPSLDLPWPAPRNPWGLDRSTAGSSSGSAVAVAGGLVLAATGTDTGGSIRDPAALCGAAGLKPTRGLCEIQGLFPFASSLDTVGPMARTAQDCALMLDAMARTAPGCAQAAARPARGLRVGVAPRLLEEVETSPGVQAALARASGALSALGASLVSVELPPLAEYQACVWTIAMAELYEAHAKALAADGGEGLGRLLRLGLAVGAAVPAHAYIAALRRRVELAWLTERAMEGVDVLLLPAQDAEASPLSEILGDLPFQKPSFTMPFNVTGQPAMTVAAGEGAHGLPVGVQLAARVNDEATLCRAACALERELQGHLRRPPDPAPP